MTSYYPGRWSVRRISRLGVKKTTHRIRRDDIINIRQVPTSTTTAASADPVRVVHRNSRAIGFFLNFPRYPSLGDLSDH